MRIAAGRFKGRALPEAGEARPVPGRLKTSLFSVLQPWVEGGEVLDLFAGVGGLGLEALSRGARGVTLVENDRRAARALEAWAAEAGVTSMVRVLVRDALRTALPSGPYDVVFADPPFSLWQEDAAEAATDLVERATRVLGPEGLLALKVPARATVPAGGLWTLRRRTDVGSVGYALLSRDVPAA
jgi:16S rRNA (guanine966-N2)-methyltransferase